MSFFRLHKSISLFLLGLMFIGCFTSASAQTVQYYQNKHSSKLHPGVGFHVYDGKAIDRYPEGMTKQDIKNPKHCSIRHLSYHYVFHYKPKSHGWGSYFTEHPVRHWACVK